MAIGDLTAGEQVRVALICAQDWIEELPPETHGRHTILAEIREALKRIDEAGAA